MDILFQGGGFWIFLRVKKLRARLFGVNLFSKSNQQVEEQKMLKFTYFLKFLAAPLAAAFWFFGTAAVVFGAAFLAAADAFFLEAAASFFFCLAAAIKQFKNCVSRVFIQS